QAGGPGGHQGHPPARNRGGRSRAGRRRRRGDQGRARACRRRRQSGSRDRHRRSVDALTFISGEDRVSTALNGAVRFVDLQAQIQSLQPALNQAIQAVLGRGDFILGKDVEHFEQEFAAYCGVPHAVGVDSGLSALELALRALRIGPGDEVITQANTFIASAGAILAVGARPVLVDCDDDGVIRPDAVRAALTPATRAIMPVHLFGRICDIEAIMAIADAAGVPVVEDACQAHGALLNGRRAGSFGIASAVSFYPAKNLGALGDAGMLLTRSAELADPVRQLRDALQAGGLETGIHYPTPLHLQPALNELGYRRGAFPTAERLAAHSRSLPIYPEMSLAQVELVAGGIRAGLPG